MERVVTAPRRYAARILLAALIDVLVLGAAAGAGDLVRASTGRPDLSFLGFWAIVVPFVVRFAPLVSYRRRDAVAAPWLVFRIAWRLAYLPFRDWPPRDDEVGEARFLRAAEFGDRWEPEYAGLYRLAGRSVTP